MREKQGTSVESDSGSKDFTLIPNIPSIPSSQGAIV